MSKIDRKRRKKGKSGSQRSNERFFDNVNRAIKDLWLHEFSFEERMQLNVTSGFTKAYKDYVVATVGKASKSRSSDRLRELKISDKQVIDKAIERANTLPQEWPYMIMAVQSNGEKVWYDTVLKINNAPQLVNSPLFIDTINMYINALLSKVKQDYLLSVGLFVFNDTSIDFDSMEEQLFNYMDKNGGTDRAICMLGIQNKFKNICPEAYAKLPEDASLGKLITEYYKAK